MGSPKVAAHPDSATDTRVALAAQFVPAGARVLELGSTSLKSHLPFGCIYRSAKVAALPGIDTAKYDLVALLGGLAGGAQDEALLHKIARAGRAMVIGVSADTEEFSLLDIVRLIDRCGFRIETSAPLQDGGTIMRLAAPGKMIPLAPCSVAVLSGGMTFGERLGSQMINALLPGEADVHHIQFGDLGSARAKYDLVVLGTGQGLFHPLFANEVLDVLKRGRHAIGIFGTQQRDLLPRAALGRLIERLDIWFARGRDDVMLYGRGQNNVTYLGDWLIEQFPFGQARARDTLTVGEDTLADLPLDRAIQSIQRHRAVVTRSVAPLLCALTTADCVGYEGDGTADEFRSLLSDVFGRSYPEREMFQVDRDAVMRYRARVHRNVALMRVRIDALLRGNAVASAA
jgi:hypothetical protein